MNCSRCGRQLSENQVYINQGRVYCEDCLMDIGLSIRECDPWATYVDRAAQLRKGLEGADGLTDSERKVFDYIKDKGKATRSDILEQLKLSDVELAAQLIPLMHRDLVKERGEGGQMYLVLTSRA